MKSRPAQKPNRSITPAFLVSLIVLLALWHFGIAAGSGQTHSLFPSPSEVARAFVDELSSGRLIRDILASLFRVFVGFTLAFLIGVPIGLWAGVSRKARPILLPYVNFFRSLSPISWIPFAVLWFGVGDVPAIFLIFISAIFPLSIATFIAVSKIPDVFHNVARDYGWDRASVRKIVIPAILPELISAVRVSLGIAWVVMVAAEMIAGRDGLGFAILDARNGLRPDLVVVGMVTIGVTGVLLDRVLAAVAELPSLQWGKSR